MTTAAIGCNKAKLNNGLKAKNSNNSAYAATPATCLNIYNAMRQLNPFKRMYGSFPMLQCSNGESFNSLWPHLAAAYTPAAAMLFDTFYY